jgi:hypothetical protein
MNCGLTPACGSHVDAHPFEGQQRYRVEGVWLGGGFAYTMSFTSEAAALAWGKAKTRFHRDAVITVTPRNPMDIAKEGAAERNERRALELQQAAEIRNEWSPR